MNMLIMLDSVATVLNVPQIAGHLVPQDPYRKTALQRFYCRGGYWVTDKRLEKTVLQRYLPSSVSSSGVDREARAIHADAADVPTIP